MKTPQNIPKRLLPPIVFSLSVLVSPLLAQTGETVEEEVYELSPFEVSADSEIGYLATQTLSGTRIRSQLGDVAASIDVLTEEFLQDVGATTMYDALDYVGNVSTWGQSGGISANENQVWFANPYMARGFLTTSRTADFFDMGGKMPLDFYNKSNFTVARGPNAILFGIGSPGGIVNTTRKRPQWGKDMAEVQFRVDEYGSKRATLDVSKEIVENRLAVRGAYLYDDKKEFLKPAGHDRKAYYGAVTFRPFRNTTITVTGEDGSEQRIFRYTSTNYDAITPWINAGSPTNSGFNNTPPVDGSFGSGLDRRGHSTVVVSGQPEIPAMNWVNMAETERFEIQADLDGNGTEENHPDINAIRDRGYTADTAIWDYDDVQLHGKSRERELDWQDFSVFLTQELFVPELQLELAFNRVKTEYLLAHTFGQFYLRIDPNELLPNGNPNPNFGVPYVESGRSQVTGEINRADTARATLSYDLDLNDRKIFGMGLGRYNFLGLYEERRVNTLFAEFYRVFEPNVAGVPQAGRPLHPFNRVRNRSYLDTDLTPEGANVQPYFIPDFTPIDQDGAHSNWARNSSPRDIDDRRDSYVLAVQAYLWETKDNYDRIILTAGYRKDRESSQRLNYQRENGGNTPYEGARWRGSPFELDAAGRDAFWDGTFNYGTLGDPSLTESPTKTYSGIFKLTKDISLFYNYSDVLISASSLFTDIYDNFVDGTVGETDDFGIRWSALDGKLVTSFTLFETTAQNQRESNNRNNFKPEMEAIWDRIGVLGDNDPQAAADAALFAGFNDRFVTLRDDSSEGFEFSATANLAPGWSTRLSVSQIETIIQDRLPFVDQYIAEFSPVWEKYRAEELPATDEFDTVGEALDEIYSEIADLHALEGTVPQAQREWKVVLNTNYRFQDGRFKGWGLGGGFRWESSDIIGYAYDDNYIVDPNKPFKGEDILNVTGQVFYQTTIKGVWMRFQLNVRNLLDEDGMFPRSAVDDLTGNPYYGRQQVREPRSVFFTTTFKF